MDARDLVLRHREHAERVVVAQVLLGRERKAGQIGQRSHLVGMHASLVELAPVDRRMVIGVAKDHLRRSSCRAWSSCRLAVSIGSRADRSGA
jgi:hypothetical protein